LFLTLAQGLQWINAYTHYFLVACDNFNNYVRFIVIGFCLSVEQVTMESHTSQLLQKYCVL